MLGLQDIQRRLAMWQDVETQIHAFFQARGFVYVRTPLLTRHPGMEPNLDPVELSVHGTHPRREISAALITSPEYAMKKLLGAGMEKVYTITSVFRDHEAMNQTNLIEFQMLEWYAPGDYQDLMDETEALLHDVLGDQTSWPRLTHAQAAVDQDGEPHAEAERFFVTHYPPEQASLARLSPDGAYGERFEAFGDGLELCNGFCELTDSAEQRRRFVLEQAERKALGKTIFPIDEALLRALDLIKGPVYGNALGVDRLVMLKYAERDIRDIQLFTF